MTVTPMATLAAAMAAVLCLGVVACSPPDRGPEVERASPSGFDPGGGGERTEARLLMQNNVFEPRELTVPVGTLIILENRDEVAHTVTHGEDGEAAADAIFDIELDGGERDELVLSEPGDYAVTCRFHPGMSMVITVIE